MAKYNTLTAKLILFYGLASSKVPVPTPAGPTQLNVGEGDLIFFA